MHWNALYKKRFWFLYTKICYLSGAFLQLNNYATYCNLIKDLKFEDFAVKLASGSGIWQIVWATSCIMSTNNSVLNQRYYTLFYFFHAQFAVCPLLRKELQSVNQSINQPKNHLTSINLAYLTRHKHFTGLLQPWGETLFEVKPISLKVSRQQHKVQI